MIISGLEQAIIDHINAHAGTGAGKLGYALTVGGYGGEFDTDQDLANAAVSFPCALVLLREMGAGVDVGQGQKVRLTYTVFVAAQNRRNEAARRRGAAGKAGSYQIAWDIRQLLKMQMLGFNDQIDGLVPGPVQSVINGKSNNRSVSVYACSFSTIWYEDLAPVTDEVMGEFLELDVAWDVPPLGNVQPPLPAVEADARDLIKPRESNP